MNKVIEIQQVSKLYDDFKALDDISIDLYEGEILGLLGHNGAGKTTSMKLILGIIEASQGDIKLFNESPLGPQANNLRKQLGYLPENVSFYSQLTGREVLEYFCKLKKASLKETDRLLEQLGLAYAADRRVKTYSKGMRQRLGLAQALLGKPRLLLLDEPTAGLDPVATSDFYTNLAELRMQGTTILISSHVLPGIEKHIDRAAILGKGQLLACGSLDELRKATKLPLTLHVRGEWPDTDWQQQLTGLDVDFQHLNGKRLELFAPLERKMDIMRILTADPSVSDIDVISPTLESIYNYYNRIPS
ncbi:MAG: ABC transporter ATP-binding protein [Gammaproteobacteria bacterium]|nr:ABC transporter ATP-binding protein [Gammaproteobacteria bacterium]